MSEAVRVSLLVPEVPSVDAELAASLGSIDVHSSQIYKLLTVKGVPEAEKKEAFMASECQESPNLEPAALDLEQLDAEEEALLALKEQVISSKEQAPEVVNSYIWKINELIANIRMARAAHAGNSGRFRHYNTFIYGNPSPEIHLATVAWFRESAMQHLKNDVASIREAAAHLLELMPDSSEGDSSILLPDAETFQEVREAHYSAGGFYTLLLAGVEIPEGPIKPDVGTPILEQVRRNIGAEDYRIVVATGSTWGVNQGKKELEVPGKYNMPVKRFVGLGPGHEWTHALEAINGYRGKLALSGNGLDIYESGNEGRSVIREQLPYDSAESFSGTLRWNDIVRRHLAISLGFGATTAPRSFAEVYAIMNAVDVLYERVKRPDDPQKADAVATRRTWDLLKRVLKGTNGQGGAYLKDMVYLEGNIACWKAARNRPEMIDFGDRGKFDISNMRHIELLQKLGVLPDAA